MGPVSATITIDAPRERVYEVVADLANRPSFCDHFAERFHLQRMESSGVGAAARFWAEAPRFPIWMETVIAETDPPFRLLEHGRGARADRMVLGTAWELVEGPGSMTEVTVTFWTEPDHPLDRFREHFGAARWYRRQWAKALKRLRELVESGDPLEPLQVAGASRP